MDRTELISLLNEDLSLAYRSHIQTIGNLSVSPQPDGHQSMLDAVRRERIARLPFRLERTVELATLIDHLGGLPTTHVSPPHHSPHTRSAILEELVLERLQASRFRKRAVQAQALGEKEAAKTIDHLAQQCEQDVERLDHAVRR